MFVQSLQHNPQNRLLELTTRIKRLLKTAEPYSYEEYLAYALQLALKSAQEGNYGIGAAIIFRDQNREYVIGGRNQIFTKKNSSLHAERDALHKFQALAQKPSIFNIVKKTGMITPQDILFTRPAPDDTPKTFLVTTLETCAGCYQEILTHNTFGIKISQIISGTESEDSGSGHHLRSEKLPPTWRRMAEEQKISLFTLWDSEIQSLSQDIFYSRTRLHKQHYEKNSQTTTEILTNLKKLLHSKNNKLS